MRDKVELAPGGHQAPGAFPFAQIDSAENKIIVAHILHIRREYFALSSVFIANTPL